MLQPCRQCNIHYQDACLQAVPDRVPCCNPRAVAQPVPARNPPGSLGSGTMLQSMNQCRIASQASISQPLADGVHPVIWQSATSTTMQQSAREHRNASHAAIVQAFWGRVRCCNTTGSASSRLRLQSGSKYHIASHAAILLAVSHPTPSRNPTGSTGSPASETWRHAFYG